MRGSALTGPGEKFRGSSGGGMAIGKNRDKKGVQNDASSGGTAGRTTVGGNGVRTSGSKIAWRPQSSTIRGAK